MSRSNRKRLTHRLGEVNAGVDDLREQLDALTAIVLEIRQSLKADKRRSYAAFKANEARRRRAANAPNHDSESLFPGLNS